MPPSKRRPEVVPSLADVERGIATAKVEAAEHEAPVVVLWPKVRPRYGIAVRLVEDREEFTCTGFSVHRLDGAKVTAAVMRGLPVGALIDEAIRRVIYSRLVEAEEELVDPAAAAPDGTWAANRDAFWERRAAALRERLAGEPTGKGTGRRYPAGHLERVAEVVREACRLHEPVSVAVATTFGISKSAAANQIARARAQGLLDGDG